VTGLIVALKRIVKAKVK